MIDCYLFFCSKMLKGQHCPHHPHPRGISSVKFRGLKNDPAKPSAAHTHRRAGFTSYGSGNPSVPEGSASWKQAGGRTGSRQGENP